MAAIQTKTVERSSPGTPSASLSALPFESPLSADSFNAIAKQCRPLGLWLSLWDANGRLIQHDADGPRIWSLTWRSSFQFRSVFEKTILAWSEGNSTSAECRHAILDNPMLDGERLVLLPVWRRRLLGICVAVPTPTAMDDESFRRFCDRCQIDAAAVQNMCNHDRAGAASRPDVAALAGLIACCVEQSLAAHVARRETASLARNLGSTYEELHLIYELSAEIGIADEPEKVLARAAAETRHVSRAARLAFVLPMRPSHVGHRPLALPGGNEENQADLPLAQSNEQLDNARVFAAGCDDLSLADLHRLQREMVDQSNTGVPHILGNDIGAQPRFAWAAPWLKHAVAVPLRHRQTELGTMLAINCTDDGDFTSVDVQLLRAVADRVAAYLDNQRLYDDLAELLIGLLHALVSSIDAKDPYTCGHSERVALLSQRISEAVGLGPLQAQRAYLAGLLHDVGKIGVADAILTKPGKLTVEEFDLLKKHPEIGVQILSGIPQIEDLLPGVLYHHERMDGNGYPHKLNRKDVPRIARIICLADCLDAMTTTRTYRAFMSPTLAQAEIRRCSGTQFDPELSEALLTLDVEKLLKEAHDLAGSRLPDPRAGSGPETAMTQRFSSRPIFMREMFAERVASW